MSHLSLLKKDLQKLATSQKAKASSWFFKTGPGEYGEGDQFIGVTVPEQRIIAKKYKDLDRESIFVLLHSPVHEERLVALFILVEQCKKSSERVRQEIFALYLASTKFVNNWDLVDSSAEPIVGAYLEDKSKDTLTKLAHSPLVWERRIAMIATYWYIRKGQSAEALRVATILVHDSHDLIQKAVGWMLREIGKRCSLREEEQFLDKYAKTMPRTMLRYALERFSPEKKKLYMSMKKV